MCLVYYFALNLIQLHKKCQNDKGKDVGSCKLHFLKNCVIIRYISKPLTAFGIRQAESHRILTNLHIILLWATLLCPEPDLQPIVQ